MDEDDRPGDRQDVTLAEVARIAGVSASTVSRVIRNRDMVHPGTAERVRSAMAELGYSNSRASAVKKGVLLVPVCLPSISDPFFALVLKGIVDTASLADALVCYVDADYSHRAQEAGMIRFVESGAVGAIVTPVDSDPDFCGRLEELAAPLVYVDRSPFDLHVHRVVADDVDGAYQATKYLLSMGHRRVLFIGGDKNISTERDRLTGYKLALEEAGIAVDHGRIHEHSFDESRLAEEDTQGYLLKLDYTAIVAANDNLAGVATRALRRAGLQIPEQVSVVGYGDLPYSHNAALTTVSVPAYEMGKNAFLLYQAIREGKVPEPKEIILRPSMILRSSCAQPPTS